MSLPGESWASRASPDCLLTSKLEPSHPVLSAFWVAHSSASTSDGVAGTLKSNLRRFAHAGQMRARPVDIVDGAVKLPDVLHEDAAPLPVYARELAVPRGDKLVQLASSPSPRRYWASAVLQLSVSADTRHPLVTSHNNFEQQCAALRCSTPRSIFIRPVSSSTCVVVSTRGSAAARARCDSCSWRWCFSRCARALSAIGPLATSRDMDTDATQQPCTEGKTKDAAVCDVPSVFLFFKELADGNVVALCPSQNQC